MATKKELVNELLDLGASEPKSELLKKTNKELQSLVEDAKGADLNAQESNSIDMEALKEQMRKELLAQVKAEIEEEVKSEMKEKIKSQEVPKSKVLVDKDRLIPVMNITNHTVVYQSRKTGAEWKWSRYGDIEYMEMQELLTMRSSQRRFLDFPFVLIMDDEAVSYLGLEKMYEKMVNPDKIDSVFDMSLEKFKEILENAPIGISALVISRAKEKIKNGELDSFHKINALKEKFNIDLDV